MQIQLFLSLDFYNGGLFFGMLLCIFILCYILYFHVLKDNKSENKDNNGNFSNMQILGQNEKNMQNGDKNFAVLGKSTTFVVGNNQKINVVPLGGGNVLVYSQYFEQDLTEEEFIFKESILSPGNTTIDSDFIKNSIPNDTASFEPDNNGFTPDEQILLKSLRESGIEINADSENLVNKGVPLTRVEESTLDSHLLDELQNNLIDGLFQAGFDYSVVEDDLDNFESSVIVNFTGKINPIVYDETSGDSQNSQQSQQDDSPPEDNLTSDNDSDESDNSEVKNIGETDDTNFSF